MLADCSANSYFDPDCFSSASVENSEVVKIRFSASQDEEDPVKRPLKLISSIQLGSFNSERNSGMSIRKSPPLF